jgi:hypothetical protein
MGVIALVVIVVGLLLIVAGLYVSLAEWNAEQNRRLRAQRKPGVETDPLGAPEVLEGLAKLADALKHHRLGFQLIIFGIALVIIGGMLGGVAAI